MNNVVFRDNSAQVRAQMERNIREALERIGLIWLAKVTPLVPVDTSQLVHSMKYEIDFANKKVIVGSGVEYAPFVELGTKKMTAQPYLKPSILDFIGEYEAAVKQVLGQGWSVSADVSTIKYD